MGGRKFSVEVDVSQKQALFFFNVMLLILVAVVLYNFLSTFLVLSYLVLPFLFVFKKRFNLSERFYLAFTCFSLSLVILLSLAAFDVRINKLFLVFLLAIVNARLIVKNRLHENLGGKLYKVFSSKDLLFLLLMLLFLRYTHAGLYTDVATPRTDTTEYLSKNNMVAESLSNEGRIHFWYDKSQLGYPLYDFDPFLAHLTGGVIQYLTPGGLNAIGVFNSLFLLFFAMFGYGTYMLGSHLFENKFIGFASSLILLSTPVLANMAFYTGNFKIYAAYAVIPFALYLAVKAYSGRASPQSFSLLSAYLILTHSTTFVFFACILAVTLLFKYYSKPAELGGDLKHWLRSAAVFFGLVGFFIYSVIRYGEYISKVHYVYRGLDIGVEFCERFLHNPAPALDWHYGVFYGILVLAGILSTAYAVFLRKKGLFGVFAMIFVSSTLLLELSARVNFVGRILVGFGRIEPFFVVTYALLISSLLYYGKRGFWLRKKVFGEHLVLAAVILLLLYNAPITHKKSNAFVSDKFLYQSCFANKSTGSPPVRDRVTTYGFYGTSFHPALIMCYNFSTNGMGYTHAQHTDIYYSRLNEVKTWSLPAETSPEEAYRLYLMTAVKTVWVNVCNSGGRDFIERFDKIERQFKSETVGSCHRFLYLNAPFIEAADEVLTESNYFDVGRQNIPYERASPEAIEIYPLDRKHLLVKEEYFPRWKAVQEDYGPIPVRKSDLGLINLENANGRPIKLYHTHPPTEKALMLLSPLSLILVLAAITRYDALIKSS